jgi:hypothetical protein
MARRARRPQTKTPSYEGPSCPQAVLLAVAALGAGLGTGALLWSYGALAFWSLEQTLLVTAIGLGFGAVPGMMGGLVVGQIARAGAARADRRPYQLAGALLSGALFGALIVLLFTWLLAHSWDGLRHS